MEPNKDLPFRVPSIQEIRDDDYFPAYVNTLKKIFAEILGWPHTRTTAYIEDRLQHSWFRSWFGHETPCHDAAPVIVPEALMQQLIKCRISTVGVCKDIHHALEASRETYNMFPDTDPGYDWQRARDEIADIIKEWERKCDEATV
jgi:hypothetical protein